MDTDKAIKKPSRLTRSVKRLFDVVVSFISIIILSPVLLIIALIIKCDSPGPAIYKQARIGKDGKPFRIYKFRTMVFNADKHGPQITLSADKRVTRSGAFLRKYKLDEFAQLLNVFGGSMSFVGPRPEVEKYVQYYNEEQLRVLSVKPGITDYASLKYSNENELIKSCEDIENVYIHQIMPDKLRLNLEYIHSMSLWCDIKIMFATVKKIFI